MVFIAKSEPGGALGHVWESAGAEGAVEVDDYTAYHLLQVPDEMFFAVKPKIAEVKIEEVTVEETPKPKAKAKKTAETPETSVDELSQALNEANGAR